MTAYSPAGHFLVCHDLVVGNLTEPDQQLQLCVENCRRLLVHARENAWPIAHSYADLTSRPIRWLEPLPSEPVLGRMGASAFSNRSFRRFAAQHPTDRMVVVGCSLGEACLPTVLTAGDRGIPTILVTDAVAPKKAGPSSTSVLEIIRSVGAHRWAQLYQTSAVVKGRPRLRVVDDDYLATSA